MLTIGAPIACLILALLAAAMLWGYAAFRRDISDSRQRLAGNSRVVETASGPIEYAQAGDGPAVLISHGAGGGFDQGLELGRPLIRRGFSIIAVSRFGYLRTPSPAHPSATAQADAYARLLDALGIERAAVLGASAGGPSAILFAIRHPRRCDALILLAPLTSKPPEAAASPSSPPPSMSPWAEKILMTIVGSDAVFWLASTFAPDMVVKRVLGTPPRIVAGASKDEQARVARLMQIIQPISSRARGILNDSRLSASLTRFDLDKIVAPTLIMSARDDGYGTFTGADYTARHIPGARFIGFETGGHLAVGHQSELLDETVRLLDSAGLSKLKDMSVENASC
jgi:pimeloyl-ACP methyl ester carboxylesterase